MVVPGFQDAHVHAPFPGGTPRREDLDAVVADRPVFLFNRDVHGAWVNSKALEVAAITRDTPDPDDGRIERDPETGEPTGTLHEGAAYSFDDRHVPVPTRSEWESSILNAQQHLGAERAPDGRADGALPRS